jgi:4-amino-4-deoxy-L-arabinose transferase-like glycosyltransferase
MSNEPLQATWQAAINVALAVAVFPFLFSIRTWNNGVYRDWVALLCGAVAAACGVVGLVRRPSGTLSRRWLVLGVAAIALGVLQIVRGLGRL